MKRNGQQGMSALEMVIAMTLLMMIMMAVLPLVDQMMSRFQMARDHYVAASLAQGQIERARGASYFDLVSFDKPGVTVDDKGNDDPNGRFRRTTTVVTDAPSAGLTHMTVKVQICICSRRRWMKAFHPISAGKLACHFTDQEYEQMDFLFTEELADREKK